MAKNNRSLSLRRKEEEMADMENKTQEIKDWIEGLLKEKLPKLSFREILLDGVVLCKLANAIKRDCIKKFHKKPRMLMMKMENIAFFLTACKTRFNIPQAVIFAPTDIHDDSDPTAMRKVINVLLLMKQEMGGGPSAAEAAKQLEEAEKKRQQEFEELEAADLAAGVIVAPTPKPKPAPVVNIPDEEPHLSDDEPSAAAHEEEPEEPAKAKEPEPEELEPEPQPPPKPVVQQKPPAQPQPKPVEHKLEPKPVVTEPKPVTNGTSTHEFDYYLKGKTPTDHSQIQGKIVTQIVDVIDSELSLDSKLKLVFQLQAHINAVHHKVLLSTNDELKHLAHDMGLGNALNDIPGTKDRQWYIDFILKHGRIQ